MGMTFEDDRPGRSTDSDEHPTWRGAPSSAAKPFLWATAVASVAGAVFAAVSTHDFVQHLDRQVHSIHCSFIPGAGAQLGESGCRTVMLSPYSSLFRRDLWGGLPISLLALAVFAYLVFRAVDFALRERTTKKDTMFLVLATLLPVATSGIYGYISMATLDAVCKLCVGIYVSSGLALVLAIVAHVKAEAASPGDSPIGRWARWFGEGVAYVAILVVAYLALAPVSDKSLDGCGTLVKSDDPNNIILPLAGKTTGAPSIAVLDPLCPACKGFDERLAASGLVDELNLRVVLFPLDSTCNWMVKESMHPGACAISEAMLCDKESASKILQWAFANQESLRTQATTDEPAVRKLITEKFPSVKGCLGSVTIKNKLNKSLRWAVANALPVLTPQLFIGDKRVCDEDTDLGLEYTISAMLGRRGAQKAEN